MVLKLHLTLKYFFMYNAYYTQIYSVFVYMCKYAYMCVYMNIYVYVYLYILADTRLHLYVCRIIMYDYRFFYPLS